MKSIKVDDYMVNVPIEDIVERLRLISRDGKLQDIKVKADELVVTCPNDEHAGGHEAHPDCHINLDDSKDVAYGQYHCFACGAKGDFVSFVAKFFGSSREYAADWLKSNYGEKMELSVALEDDIVLPWKKAKKSKALDESILEKYQHWTPYLAKRKLSREMCENFKVRYDPESRQVIFPVYDMSGRLKMLARRSVDTKLFHMDEGQEKEVYGLNVIQKNGVRSCLITEGPIDMLSGWTHGIPAIATLGAVSDYQIRQLRQSCINVLYLAFDNDEAGRKFAKDVKKKIPKRIMTTDVALPGGKKDLNDLTEEDWARLKKRYFGEYQ